LWFLAGSAWLATAADRDVPENSQYCRDLGNFWISMRRRTEGARRREEAWCDEGGGPALFRCPAPPDPSGVCCKIFEVGRRGMGVPIRPGRQVLRDSPSGYETGPSGHRPEILRRVVLDESGASPDDRQRGRADPVAGASSRAGPESPAIATQILPFSGGAPAGEVVPGRSSAAFDHQ
jgi:hypothetical protein